jgi:hypothetical protein
MDHFKNILSPLEVATIRLLNQLNERAKAGDQDAATFLANFQKRLGKRIDAYRDVYFRGTDKATGKPAIVDREGNPVQQQEIGKFVCDLLNEFHPADVQAEDYLRSIKVTAPAMLHSAPKGVH